MMFDKDPLKSYLESLQETAETLNKNLEVVKSWMSIQHIHNDLFLENVNELRSRIKALEEKK